MTKSKVPIKSEHRISECVDMYIQYNEIISAYDFLLGLQTDKKINSIISREQ